MLQVLKEILISAGDIDRYYEHVPVNLWRAKRRLSKGAIFGLVEEDAILSNGKARPADITIVDRNGLRWVCCGPSPRGISTFDKAGVFGGSSWDYYKLPAGTMLPNGLAIVRDSQNRRLGATHYTIAPAHDMPLTQFRALLDELALLVNQEVA